MNPPSGSVETSATPTEEAWGGVRLGLLLMTCHKAPVPKTLWAAPLSGRRPEAWKGTQLVCQALCVTVRHRATPASSPHCFLWGEGLVFSPKR